MAAITIGHHPELTKEDAFEIFERHFGHKYAVYPEAVPRQHFTIKKNPWVAVFVRLEQEPDKTKFIFGGKAGSQLPAIVMTLTLGLFSMLLWNGLTNEVKTFIQEAPEFK